MELWISYIAIIISSLSSYHAYKANKNTNKGFEKKFKDTLRVNIKNTKYLIMSEEKRNEKVSILIEKIKDNLMYQSNEEDKISYLTEAQQRLLSKLQLDIEDHMSCIKEKTDIETNIEQAINSLNTFIDNLQ